MNANQAAKLIQELTAEKEKLQARAQELQSSRPKLVETGDVTALLAAKKEEAEVVCKIEIIDFQLESAKVRLGVLKSNEPRAQQLQKQVTENWQAVKTCLDSIDSIGEKLRANFDDLKRLENVLVHLGHEFASLTGLPPSYPRIVFCERLPVNLNPYSTPLPLTHYIVEVPRVWSPWQPPRPPE